jgi:integrase
MEEALLEGSAENIEEILAAQEKPSAKPMSLTDAWDKFLLQLEARKLSPTSMYKYGLLRERMEDFAEEWKLHSLKDFNVDVLESFQASWTTLGDVAALKAMERLKGFFRVATGRKWILEDPSIALRGPKPKPRPTIPFSHAEMKRILAAIERHPNKSRKFGQPNAIRLRAFVLTLRYTGMRLGDVTTLSTDRLFGNKILLYTQKTGVPVYCVLPQFVADLLKCLPRISEQYFFWTGNSTMHTVNGIWQRTLQSLFKRAEITNGFAHRFRDTFSVELLLAGVPIANVAVALGHTNIAVTQRHYNPWVRDRQVQLEADLQRAWNRDPIVLLNSSARDVEPPGIVLPN